ncbi:MAG: type II toxin-antitoxin system YafQ family toxin [Fibromonadales bacterium]|nr:type II toxin-antitoxin system YafQ family toxin [Fibromonadales bacterium]
MAIELEPKLKLEPTTRYKKDRKRMKKRGKDLSLLKEVLKKLQNLELLEPKHKDHPLKGDYIGFRECHITPDWLLVYAIDESRLVLVAFRTGTHSDLFKK